MAPWSLFHPSQRKVTSTFNCPWHLPEAIPAFLQSTRSGQFFPILSKSLTCFLPQSIGYLAAFIALIETNPIPLKLSRSTPFLVLTAHKSDNPYCIGNVYYDTLICTAAHSAKIDRRMRKTILASIKSDKALRAVESMVSQDPSMDAFVRTTRAVDIVGGGVKS